MHKLRLRVGVPTLERGSSGVNDDEPLGVMASTLPCSRLRVVEVGTLVGSDMIKATRCSMTQRRMRDAVKGENSIYK